MKIKKIKSLFLKKNPKNRILLIKANPGKKNHLIIRRAMNLWC